MTAIKTDLYLGDCLEVLSNFDDDSFDLIMTSPPYADCRSKTYGGTSPDEYVNWFLPRAEQFLRVLKPSGTFILNIKEKAVNGERHTYVIELILEMREAGMVVDRGVCLAQEKLLSGQVAKPIQRCMGEMSTV